MINFLLMFLNPFVIFVLIIFISTIFYVNKKLGFVFKNLNSINNCLSKFNKDDLLYRFKEFDTFMCANTIVSNYWTEYKETLIFENPQIIETAFEIANNENTVKTTVNPISFFNEDTLVKTQYNYKLTQTIPTLLTGLGPLFTFMHIVIRFSYIDFSSQETTLTSVSTLIANIKIGALISVIAVASALLYMAIERLLYEKYCKFPIKNLQHLLTRLFDPISSEKFLIALINDNRIQNEKTKDNFKNISNTLSKNFENSISSLVPYFENIIYSINKLKDKDDSKDLVKKLFKEE